MLSFWLLTALGVAVGVLVFVNERDLERRVRERRSRGELQNPPRVVLILSLEEEQTGIQQSLDLLGRLNYSNHELMLAVKESAAIPRAKLPSPVKIVFAGPASDGISQEVHNLLTAVQAAGKLAEVVAFAPVGAQVDAGWLTALVRPLRQEGAMVTAGSQWRLPARPGFWGVVDNLWSEGVAAPEAAFAMWRSAFDDHRVADQWKKQGFGPPKAPVAFARGAVVGVPWGIGGAGWFDGRRDTRRFLLTLGACPAMALAMGGMASGSLGGLAAFVLMLLAAFWQGARRVAMARAALQPSKEWFRRHLAAHLLAMPVAWWVGLARWAASAADTARYNEANHEG